MDNLSKLKSIKTKSVPTVNEQSLVVKSPLSREQVLPLVIKPRYKGMDLADWVKNNRSEFDADLLKHGGVLLRGFDIQSLEDFGRFVGIFDTAPLPYMFRSSPRHELNEQVKHVYNSTVYPKEEKINLHNESSYSRSWGMKILFCCLQVAAEGGETPIADSRRILADIPPALVQKFRDKGVLYRRKLINGVGMSWQEVFQTTDRKIVEDVCHENDIRYTFISEDHLEIEWNKKAVYTHPQSNEETWFNHVFFFNKYSRYEELGIHPGDPLPADLIHTDTLFGDGSDISMEEYLQLKQAYDKNTISFLYEKGDIIFLDNMLAAHGRSSYKGSRLIATAIIEPAGDK